MSASISGYAATAALTIASFAFVAAVIVGLI